MNKREASILAARILARYPSGRSDEATLATWTEELLERFAGVPEAQVRRLAVAYCRRNPSHWPPGIDALSDWVAERLRAEAACRQRLPEPRPDPETIAKNRARVRALVSRVCGQMGKT